MPPVWHKQRTHRFDLIEQGVRPHQVGMKDKPLARCVLVSRYFGSRYLARSVETEHAGIMVIIRLAVFYLTLKIFLNTNRIEMIHYRPRIERRKRLRPDQPVYTDQRMLRFRQSRQLM